jgi:hypothetical protein
MRIARVFLLEREMFHVDEINNTIPLCRDSKIFLGSIEYQIRKESKSIKDKPVLWDK